MAVDGERWWRAQRHTSTDQNYSWAADGSHQLLIISTNGCRTAHRKRFPSSRDLKLVLERHKLPPERPFCLNFVSKAAVQSLLGFGLLSVNFKTMEGKQ